MELHTDDYEAMPAPMPSPRAPSAWPGHMGQQAYPQMPGVTRTGISHPAAPNSLAPMALGSSRGFAPTTNRGHEDAPKGRPDFRMGVMIALAGAMIGGTLGVAMNNARHNDRVAAASAPALPPTQAMNALPPQQMMPATTATALVPNVGAPMQQQMQQQPQVVPTTAFTAVAVTGDTKPTTDKPGKPVRGGHATIAKPQPQKPQGGRVSVATGINDSTPPAPPPKKDPPPKKGGGGGSTEADLLREAISEGGNSLGGSK